MLSHCQIRAVLLAAVSLLPACASSASVSGSIEVGPDEVGAVRNTGADGTKLDLLNTGPGDVIATVGESHKRELYAGDSLRVTLRSGQTVDLYNRSDAPAGIEYKASRDEEGKLSVKAWIGMPSD